MNFHLLLIFLIYVGTSTVTALEPEIDQAQLPRIPPTEPGEALDTFEIRPGFALKLVAHEPAVVDPIALAFDEDGGLYVIEMRGYSERREDALGRIRYLRDQDGDGTFETSTIFKAGLKWPTGIICYKGGVFVGATPDLSYFKDRDGDGVCDEEHLIFTGFGGGKPELNMQALFNSFRWGPDNRIWGATGANGGSVTHPNDSSAKPVSLSGADFSFDPEKLDFRAENGTAQYGLTFDAQGRRFVCSNSRHALWVAYERGQVNPNPYYDLPPALINIPDDGAAAPVFRISPDEPWRIVRTRWRVSGVVRGMVEGGGRVSGYFTSATGIHAYWGNAYGQAYQNNLFVGDVGSNLVHRKILRHKAGQVQPVATRAPDERDTEFLRSRDNWFRPASFATGPDGCLYICDMYREVIEHPWSLPPGIKKHLDLNSGNDRGRIYRVEPVGFKRPAIPKLSQAGNAELQRLAESSTDDWRQTTARRLLYERGQPIAPKPTPSPFPALLTSQDSLIHKLPEWKGDPWLETTVLNSLRNEAAIQSAWSTPALANAPDFASRLANMTGRTANRAIIEALLDGIPKTAVTPRTVALISALKAGLLYANGDWSDIEKLSALSKLFSLADGVAGDPSNSSDARLIALQLLALQSNDSNQNLRKRIVSAKSSPEILVTEAVRGIHDRSFIIENFGKLSPEARALTTARMTQNPDDALMLLNAIATNSLLLEAVSAETLQALRRHSHAEVAQRAAEVLPRIETRSQVIARYQPALRNAGDPVKGEVAFNKACISCHQTEDGSGILFGPPTATFKTAGKDSILGNILEPDKEVAPQYQAFDFTLKNGESYLGMIGAEDNRNVTLLLPGGMEKTFPRTEVRSMRGIGRSLMPEGLEQVLSVEEMTDLLAYLTQ